MQYCPHHIVRLLEEKYNFPSYPLFGVVATRTNEGVNCRTMRIYDLDEQGRLILLTHTGTKKWKEMRACPVLSICLVSNDKLTQVIVSGNVTLETKKEAPQKAERYWGQIREDVKMNYDPVRAPDLPFGEYPHLKAPDEVPETSGIVTVHPDFWESLELVLPYTASSRFHYRPAPQGWTKEKMNLG